MYTTIEIAKKLRVNRDKVIDWINSGQLPAINVSSSNSSRPRYRVEESALQQFLIQRSSVPRSSTQFDLREFFGD